MNLKSTIDNTNKHINDLKLAKNKINDKIISGGGTIADTISAIPDAIDGMLKENYKKVAYVEPNIGNYYNGWYEIEQVTKGTKITLPLNLNFNPSEIYLGIGLINRNTKSYKLITKTDEFIELSSNLPEAFTFKITDFSNRNITLECTYEDSPYNRIFMSTILAIE